MRTFNEARRMQRQNKPDMPVFFFLFWTTWWRWRHVFRSITSRRLWRPQV